MSLGGELPSMRGMYKAAKGYKLVHADWKQLELRVRAYVMGDTKLEEDIIQYDVYSANAVDWFGLKCGKSKKEVLALPNGNQARQSSKIIHLASQYAAGTGTIHKQAIEQDRLFKFELTRRLHQKFLETYHLTKKFWEEELERVLSCGYSETRITGRRRYYPRPPPITETANYPVQGTAGDIANISMIGIDEELTKLNRFHRKPVARIIIQLHDAFDIEAREEVVSEVEAIVVRHMEAPRVINGRTVTFPVDLKVADLWSEA